jgi:hypothetical protein
MNSFFSVKDSRQRLDRQMILRLDPDLHERLNATIQSVPALSGVSKSEFVRRAMRFALRCIQTEMAQGV